MMSTRRLSLATLAALGLAACGPSKDRIRADSIAVAASSEQARLSKQLAAQKDSLTRVVLQADDFIMHIDSSVSRVVGKPKGKKKDAKLDPLAQQLQNRKAVMERVDALVARTRETAKQLAQANKDNAELKTQLATDEAMINDLNTTIKRQTATIDALSTRVDSLNGVTRELGATIASLEAQHNKAFYVIGKEDDLLKRGVIVQEGGANFLIAHPGRTIQISRNADASAFTAVDQRAANVIAMPDPARRYRVVSRQSLDYATVDNRDNESFTGNLKITKPAEFWGASRFLVVVEQ
jgi:DNA repair exonuclease SbcCD ATPase subunit